MNKIKKTAFGVVLAGLAFGFSAFTTLKNTTEYRYYQVDSPYAVPNVTTGYVYYSDDRCELGGDICSALWDIGSNLKPIDGASLPTTGVTFRNGSIIAGHFE